MRVRITKAVFSLLLFAIMVLQTGLPAEGSLGADHPKTFVIGLPPEQNIFKIAERYTPLAEYLSKKTGLDVRVRVFPGYEKMMEDFKSSGLDAAFFGSLAYVLARERLGVTAMVRPEDENGSSLCHGLVFVRKDSGINGVQDMRGKRFAFVDPATSAGFLLPLVYLHDHGIDDYKSYFRETYFTGTYEDAIYDVLDGRADIGAGKNTVIRRLEETDPRIRSELKFLTRSPDLPEITLAVRKDVDPQVRDAVREALLRMRDDPSARPVLKSIGAQGFVQTSDADYKPVIGYLSLIGSDPKRFHYQIKQ